MGDVLTKLMGSAKNAKNKPKRGSVANPFEELKRKRSLLDAADRSTKVVKYLGDTISAVAISADETMFAGGGTMRSVCVFSTRTGHELACFKFDSGVNAIAFTHTKSGAKLLVGDFSGALSVLDLRKTPIVPHHEGSIKEHPKLLLQHMHSSSIVGMALAEISLVHGGALPRLDSGQLRLSLRRLYS